MLIQFLTFESYGQEFVYMFNMPGFNDHIQSIDISDGIISNFCQMDYEIGDLAISKDSILYIIQGKTIFKSTEIIHNSDTCSLAFLYRSEFGEMRSGGAAGLAIDIFDLIYYLQSFDGQDATYITLFNPSDNKEIIIDSLVEIVNTTSHTFFNGYLVFGINHGEDYSSMKLAFYDLESKKIVDTIGFKPLEVPFNINMSSIATPCQTLGIYQHRTSLNDHRRSNIYYLNLETRSLDSIFPSSSLGTAPGSSSFTEYLASMPEVRIDSVDIDDAFCGMNTGVIHIHHRYMRGRGIRYELDNGRSSVLPMFDELSAGDYVVTMVDTIWGCSYVSDTIHVGGATPSWDVSMIPAHCAMSNGRIRLHNLPTGATLSLDRQAAVMDSVFQGLDPGPHRLIIEITNGCSDTLDFFIDEVDPPYLTIESDPDHCQMGDGILNISLDHGTQPVTWRISDTMSFNTISSFFDLYPGVYDIEVQDSLGCIIYQQAVVESTDEPILALSSSQASHCDQSDGSIEVEAIGQLPITFVLEGHSRRHLARFDSLAAGIYSVVAIDAFGCVSDTLWVSVDNVDGPGIDLVDIIPSSCAIDNGVVHWSQPTSPDVSIYFDGIIQSQSSVTDVSAGTHLLEAHDAQGCLHSQIVIVPEILMPRFSELSYDSTTCLSAIVDVQISIDGGAPPFHLEVDHVPMNPNQLQLSSGSHHIVVTDSTGCSIDTSIYIHGKRVRSIHYTITQADCGEHVGLVQWYSDESIDSILVDDSLMIWNEYMPLSIGRHDIMIKSDTSFCPWTTSLEIGLAGCDYYIPNVFSPNNDGLNDVFKVYSGSYADVDYQLEIFDRWGAKFGP